jgi:hypothetical protein
MTKKLLPHLGLLCFFLLGLNLMSEAQNGSIKGKLSDTTNYKPMAYSSIALIRKDSVLQARAFANQNSEFQFLEIPADTYRLLITRPTYADYEEIVSVQAGEAKDLGTIALLSKENLLREVLVKDFSAIKIKGDTTEFLVDSFLVNKNSNVEDLLKRLPGIQVDKSGKITAQGQEVKKVLVDGEEFFGNDPTVATKNLRADNVETVQVFDQKSEQTVQTGIDDGTKEKTINLTLKEEAKKGYFGKVGAGIGTRNNSSIQGVTTNFGKENRYEGEAMYNNFKGKRKASFFSNFSNTNKTGLNWEDREKYMGGNNVEYDEASGYMYSFYEYDPNNFNGNGIPQTLFAGGNYSDKVNNDKLSYNLTGTYREGWIKGADKNYTQYILPDTMYFNNQINKKDNHKTSYNFTGKTELKLDSLTTLTIKANVTQSRFDNIDEFTSENYNGFSQKVNSNVRTNKNTGESLTGNYSIGFNKKFKKTGRSTNLLLDHRFNNKQSDGYLLSYTVFYSGDTSEQNLDQLRKIEEKGNTVGGRLSYTEPLTKKLSLIADYDLHYTTNHSLINTLNKNASGSYINRVDSLSNDLNYDIGIQKGGLTLRFINKKVNASIGGRISYTNLTQKNLIKDTTQYQNFLNIFPSANFNYKLGTTKNLRLGYNGSTRQPTLQQINPIQDLSNPLVVYKGNPNLKQNFDNDFNLNFNSYKPLSGRNFYASLNYSFTLNDFANYDEVDQLGRRVYRSVNVDGNQNFNGYMGYYFKIKKLNLGINQSMQPGWNKSAGFINGLANTNNNIYINYDISIDFEVEEKFEFYLSPSISYNRSTTSLRKDVVTEYRTYGIYTSANVMLPKRFNWFIDAQWNIREKTEVFTQNNNTVIVSANVSRNFLKDENLVAKIGVEDLLNQNIGFERNANSNYINENTYLVLKRYFMFSLTYNFNNGPKK